jgi:hypothetical protein
VRIFKNKWFSRFAKKEGITTNELKGIVRDIEKGLWDADLGGGVYKKRVARPGAGKSGGYRTIVFFKNGERTFFQYCFPKSARENIDMKELRFLKESAKFNLHLIEEHLNGLISDGEWIEF